MPSSDADIGYNSSLEFSTDGGTTWTTMADVTSISPPNEAVDVHDVTHMKSPSKTREFTDGLIDPGECTLDMLFEPGSATDVYISAMTGHHDARITFPSGYKWLFSCFKTGYEPDVPLDDTMTATATFKVSGPRTGEAA